MTRRTWLILLVSLVSIFIFSGCGKAVYAVKKENTTVKLTTKQMESVINTSAEERGWMIKKVSDGLIHLTYFRGKVMAKVGVSYTNSSYSIDYLDSQNLKYDGKNIHGTYNKWVEGLEQTIDKRLYLISNGLATETGAVIKESTITSSDFKVGKTTKSDVMEKLGGPTSVSRSSDGQEILSYDKSRVSGKAWIPFYYGNDRVVVNHMSFTFKNDILTAFSEQH